MLTRLMKSFLIASVVAGALIAAPAQAGTTGTPTDTPRWQDCWHAYLDTYSGKDKKIYWYYDGTCSY